jgi:acetoacetate decarboxylase
MKKPRYVKSIEELMQEAQRRASAGPLQTEAQNLTIEYATDPETVKAMVPQPLVANEEGLVQLSFGHAVMRPGDGVEIPIGTFNFGVHVTYEGKPGIYVVTMAFDDEVTVITGREMFGEPKKIADIAFRNSDDTVAADIARHGITFAAFKGRLGKAVAPQEYTSHSYTFKFTLKVDGSGFDHDPQMLRLIWKHKQLEARDVTGELSLFESAFDPVIDFPVQRLLKATWSRTLTSSSGEDVCTVPAMSMFPFIGQRYDDLAAYATKKK